MPGSKAGRSKEKDAMTPTSTLSKFWGEKLGDSEAYQPRPSQAAEAAAKGASCKSDLKQQNDTRLLFPLTNNIFANLGHRRHL